MHRVLAHRADEPLVFRHRRPVGHGESSAGRLHLAERRFTFLAGEELLVEPGLDRVTLGQDVALALCSHRERLLVTGVGWPGMSRTPWRPRPKAPR